MTTLYVAFEGGPGNTQAYGPYESEQAALERHPTSVVLSTNEHHHITDRKPSLAQRLAGERGTIVLTGNIRDGFKLRGIYRSETGALAVADTYDQARTMTLNAPLKHPLHENAWPQVPVQNPHE